MADGRDVGRREFVTAVGVVAGVAATAACTRTIVERSGEAEVPDERESAAAAPQPDPEVAQFFGELRGGTPIDRWTVDAVHPTRMGAVPVVLRTAEGARFQVDVLRRDRSPGAPQGVANTETLSLFLSNRGDGSTATDEEQGLGAMALAAALARREAQARPPELLTMRERREQHPLGGYSVLSA
jgi:hypothetical protein